jgi:hypothetical protein
MDPPNGDRRQEPEEEQRANYQRQENEKGPFYSQKPITS